jgi:hypothetical protein
MHVVGAFIASIPRKHRVLLVHRIIYRDVMGHGDALMLILGSSSHMQKVRETLSEVGKSVVFSSERKSVALFEVLHKNISHKLLARLEVANVFLTTLLGASAN